MNFLYKYYLLVVLSLSVNAIQAQSTLINQGFISVDSNTAISALSHIENTGTINNHKNSTWAFIGNNQQTINSNTSLSFGNLLFNNSFNTLLGANASVQNQINFVSGKILLANNSITLQPNASIIGYNNSSYIVTNGLGNLIQSAPANQNTIYPVGTIDDYLPFSLNNKGTVDLYSIRTQDSSYLKYNISNGLGLLNPVTSLAVNKTWIVNEATPGGADFDVNLQWNATEELPAFNRNVAEIRYYNYDDSSWKTASNYIAASGSNPYSITKNISGITNLNNTPIGVFTIGAPLPVEWLSFDGKKNKNDVLLNWQTTNSIRNSHFILQRSINANDFSNIATIKANTIQHYQYNDIAAFETNSSSVLYYRLKQVDLDGRFSFSKTISLKNDIANDIIVSPNPAINHINVRYISLLNEPVTIAITNIKGSIIYTSKFSATKGENNFRINIAKYASGIYYLTLTNTQGKVYTQELIKH